MRRTALLSVLLALALAAPAASTIPLRTCGTVSSKGMRYVLKSHLTPCSKVKRWSTRILAGGRSPTGWRCKRFKVTDPVRFRCEQRIDEHRNRDFYAIRRK